MNLNNPIDEQILLQFLLGNATSDEVTRVEKWLKESEANRKRLDQVESLWVETGKLSPPPVAVDVQAAWVRVAQRIAASPEERFPRKQNVKIVNLPVFRWVTGVAATLLLMLGIWWLSGTFERSSSQITLNSGGEILTDTLPDGTQIALNMGSGLVYPEHFGKKTREVSLEGEAYFIVAPDPSKPFTIRTGFAQITVTGTSFNVNAYPGNEVVVTVDEGSVILFAVHDQTGDTASVILTKGMTGRVSPEGTPPETLLREDPDALFWYDRSLVFKQTPLQEVFTLLATHYQVSITCDHPDIQSCRLTATFTNEPVDIIAGIIADAFNLSYSLNGQLLIFHGNGCLQIEN